MQHLGVRVGLWHPSTLHAAMANPEPLGLASAARLADLSPEEASMECCGSLTQRWMLHQIALAHAASRRWPAPELQTSARSFMRSQHSLTQPGACCGSWRLMILPLMSETCLVTWCTARSRRSLPHGYDQLHKHACGAQFFLCICGRNC